MQLYHHIPLVIIMLPMVVALIMPLVPEKAARNITLTLQLTLAVLSLWLLSSLLNAPAFTYSMGYYSAPWGNELRAGLFETVMSCVFATVMFFSIMGDSNDTVRDVKNGRIRYYYLMIDLITASMMALVYTNDIFTAYVFIEINTLAACAIVAAKESGETIKATIKYMIMSVMGSGLFLMSTAILYSITGHLLMEPANEVITELAAEGRYTVPMIMTLALYAISVSVKSALFPFHTWLPDAHGNATTTSSAVLSGLVIKGYIILMIKLIFRVYGIDTVNKLGVLPVLFALGLVSMIAASVIALVQKDIKRMIAYSSVAHVGYIFMGIGLGTLAGFTAASFHVIAHAFTKSMLFIAAGALINAAGSKNLSDMAGVGWKNKIAGIAFVTGGLSLIGVPLFAAFPSKFYLAYAASQNTDMWIAVTVMAFSTFLSALYYVPAMFKIYASGAKQGSSVGEETGSFATPTLACLIVANIAIGVFCYPLLYAIERGFAGLG